MRPQKVITYGRSSQNERSFPSDQKMSRIHCQIIKYDDDTYKIVDFGSANGTWINGRCIPKNIPQVLQPTDVVRIGETTLCWMNDFSGVGSSSGLHGGGYDPQDQEEDVGIGDSGDIRDGDDDRENRNDDSKDTNNMSVFVFLCGLLSLGLVAYIVINYFTSFSHQVAYLFGGTEATIKMFPIYLRGMFGVGGQWVPMIVAIVAGSAADLIDSLTDTDDSLASFGKVMANIGITIAVIFLLLAIFAEQIVQ